MNDADLAQLTEDIEKAFDSDDVLTVFCNGDMFDFHPVEIDFQAIADRLAEMGWHR